MSGTSLLKYRVRLDTAAYAAATYPVGPRVSRRVVANNLDHYADSFGQVRMCFSASAIAGYGPVYVNGGSDTTLADVWYSVRASDPFPIPLRADGSSYKVLVRVAAKVGGDGHPGQVAIVLAPLGRAPALLDDVTDAVAKTAEFSSASATWQTLTSQGSGGYTNMLELSAAEVAGYMTVTGTPIDLAGDDAGVAQCLVQVVVFGLQTVAGDATDVQICAAHAMEWVG